MSGRSGKIIVIGAEKEAICAMCGKKAELRPYGPGYTRICWECAQKDPEGTTKRMRVKLFGEPE
jgi:hypothetical protein